MHADAYVEYGHQRTSEAIETILAILGCVTEVPIKFDFATKHKYEKGTLTTHITAQMPA